MGIFETFANIISHRPSVEALLFDLDGTLVDTMARHYRAYRDVFASYGGMLLRADFDKQSGPPANTTIPLFAACAGLDIDRLPPIEVLHEMKNDTFVRSLVKDPPVTLPVAKILLNNAASMKIAIITSGNRNGASAILQATGLHSAVDVLVTGDDVTSGKPAPDPYLLGLEKLGVDAENGIAFEDHEAGIRSATLAGLQTLDVRNGALISPSRF